MLEPQELSVVHPGYAEYLYRWDYYMRSYMGAEEYRDGAYLRKYIAEEQSPGNAYQQRLLDTALQNHARLTVDAYRSFVFRNPPTRTLGTLVDNPFVVDFVNNADMDNNTMTAFMREVNDQVLIYGGCWVGTDKGSYQVDTQAEAQDMNLRAYAKLYNPTQVRNWSYEKQVNGQNVLQSITVVDEVHEDHDVLRVWYPDRVEVYKASKKDFSMMDNNNYAGDAYARSDNVTLNYGNIIESETFENPLGYVPFIHVHTDKSYHKGVGTSHIGDVCDLQREIYNLTSEMYESIRLSSHPSIVAEASADINGGSGAIITVDENTQVNPYLLQASGASVDSILSAIEQKTGAIEGVTHLAATKAKKGPQSGIALQVERDMLNVKLSDLAGVLERAERLIWRMWFDWEEITPDEEFEIHYEKKFDLRDKHQEIALFEKAKNLVPNEIFQKYLDEQIAKLLIENEEDLQFVIDGINPTIPASTPGMTHPPMQNPEDMVKHMREMMQQGLTNEQILDLHPEITDFFTNSEE
jgi:hypothetical protein